MKTVLITGCSTGIGREMVHEFSRQGYYVFATARKLEAIQDLAGEKVAVAKLDVTKAEDIKAVVAQIEKERSHLDVLVNNAGYGLMGPVAEVDMVDVRKQFETNVFAVVALSQAVSKLMIKEKSGIIVTIGSVAGILTSPFSGIYSASKAAAHHISDALRLELAPFNIRVLTIQPGSIQSSFGKNAADTLHILPEDSAYKKMEKTIQRRAQMSQENPTATPIFVKTVVDFIVSGSKKAYFRAGKKSGLLPFLKRWVPTPLSDWLLKLMFGLK